MGVYFKCRKATSVAVLGSNNKNVFYRDKATLINDPDDIYIYSKKIDVLVRCDENANEIRDDGSTVVPGQRVLPTPSSFTTYQGFEGAKKRQLEAERVIERDKQDQKNELKESTDKKSIETELSSEDDLSVSDEDFDFEKESEEEKGEKKRKKSKKKLVVEKDSKKKIKKSKPKSKKKTKKKKDDFKKRKSILDKFSR